MKREGSLTIEAALIFPVVLFTFALVLHTGIDMHMELRETAYAIMEETDLDTVPMFYRWKKAGELVTDED